MKSFEEFKELLMSDRPLIWVRSYEESRVIEDFINSDLVKKTNDKNKISKSTKIMVWSVTQGLININDCLATWEKDITSDRSTFQPVGALKAIADYDMSTNEETRMIIFMRDLHSLFNIPTNVRKIRDIINHFARNRKTLVLISPNNNVPDEIQKETYVVNYDYPDTKNISNIFDITIENIKKMGKIDNQDPDHIIFNEKEKYKIKYSEDERNNIIKASKGLTKNEIIYSFSRSIHNTDDGCIDYNRIINEKKNIISKSQVLQFWTGSESFENMGGHDRLKEWFNEREHAVTGNALKFGVRSPKGCLLVGVQGCGKTMAAKALKKKWNLPLLRLDMGRIFSGTVGSSERNMRDMIDQAEACAPVVLLIDEIEKGCSGTGSSNNSDGGTTSRVFGTFIQWLNDKTKMVFVIATANDVGQLPPDLMRKGRFDSIWFVDLPSKEEREDIFKIHIKKIGRKIKNFDIKKLASIQFERDSKKFNYSGSEIEEAINDTLFSVFCHNQKKGLESEINGENDIKTKDIIKTLKESPPISCTSEKKIKKIREWGMKHAKPTSTNNIRKKERKSKELKSIENTASKINIQDLGL